MKTNINLLYYRAIKFYMKEKFKSQKHPYMLMTNPVKIRKINSQDNDENFFIIIDESEITSNYKNSGLPIIFLPELKAEIDKYRVSIKNQTAEDENTLEEPITKINPDITAEVFVLGSRHSGKTSLIKKFMGERFDGSLSAWSDREFDHHYCEIDNFQVKFNINEIRSKTGWSNTSPNTSSKIMLLIDITNRNSLEDAQHLVEQTAKYASLSQIILITTKHDLEKIRQINAEDLEKFAKKNSIKTCFEFNAHADPAKSDSLAFFPFHFAARQTIEEKKILLPDIKDQLGDGRDSNPLSVKNLKNKLSLTSLEKFLDTQVYLTASEKLNLLEKLFLTISHNKNNLYTHTRASAYKKCCTIPLTSTQQKHIGILKQAYINIVKANLENAEVIEKTSKKEGLIDFNKSNTWHFFKSKSTGTRDKIDTLLPNPEPNNPVSASNDWETFSWRKYKRNTFSY